jgi:hypothetical protein
MAAERSLFVWSGAWVVSYHSTVYLYPAPVRQILDLLTSGFCVPSVKENSSTGRPSRRLACDMWLV